jgi:hypothetical protein
VERAIGDPHLAVLSAIAHGGDDDASTAVAIASAAAVAAADLPESLRMLCFALIESSLGEATRKSFEMLPQGQRFFSETQRRSFAEGQARAIVRILERRGVPLSAEQRERILGCSDIATLEAWLDRVITAGSVEEVFVDS